MTWLGTVSAILALVVLGRGEARAPRKPVEKVSTAELISRLSSEKYQDREEATRALLKREGVGAALRQALLAAPTEEERRRIANILKVLDSRLTKQRLDRLSQRLRDGRVDEAVDQLVFLAESLDESQRRLALELAERLVAKARKQPGMDSSNLRVWAQKSRLIVNSTTKPDALLAASKSWSSGLIVSQGGLKIADSLVASIIFANGDVTARLILGYVVVCDGKVEADSIHRSLILATGPVRDRDGRLLAGMTGPGVVQTCYISDNCREGLGVVKFFDPRQLGIELVPGDAKKLIVRKVTPSGLFGKSGIQPADRVLTINGIQVTTTDGFRLAVRAQAMADRQAELIVDRPGKGTLKFSVGLSDALLASEGQKHESGPRPKLRMAGHDSTTALALSPSGKILASAGLRDKHFKIWDLSNGEMIAALARDRASTKFGSHGCLAFSLDGKMLVTSTRESAKVWDTTRWTHLHSFEGRLGFILHSLAFSSDHKSLYLAHSGSVGCWPLRNKRDEGVISAAGPLSSYHLFTVAGNKVLATNLSPPNVEVWNVAPRKLLKTLRSDDPNLMSVAVSPDAKRLAAGSGQEAVHIWDLASGKHLAKYRQLGQVSCLAFSPDSKTLAIGYVPDRTKRDQPGPFLLIDVESGKELARITAHDSLLCCLAFTADGRSLISAACAIKVWDVDALKRSK